MSRDVRLGGDRVLRTSCGMFGFTVTKDEVLTTIPDRFGNPTVFNFTHSDWDRIMQLCAEFLDECR